jgi:hypothetical protein
LADGMRSRRRGTSLAVGSEFVDLSSEPPRLVICQRWESMQLIAKLVAALHIAGNLHHHSFRNQSSVAPVQR